MVSVHFTLLTSMLVSPKVSSMSELKPKPVIMLEWGQVRSSAIRHFWLILWLKFRAFTVTWEIQYSTVQCNTIQYSKIPG